MEIQVNFLIKSKKIMTDICFDIETIPAFEKLSDAPEEFKIAWENFAGRRYPEETPEVAFENWAGLHPEFGKVACISVIVGGNVSKVKSFWLAEEIKDESKREGYMLTKFGEYVSGFGDWRFVGHNIKKFDIPYLIVRFVANRVKIPKGFRIYGVKPWESVHLDTMEIWTGGVYGSIQCKSLEAICMVCGIQSPKADFSGSEVARIFYEKGEGYMKKIVKYCERDTMAAAILLETLWQMGLFEYPSPAKKNWR